MAKCSVGAIRSCSRRSRDQQIEIDGSHQLSIKRARLGVEILKRLSDNKTKFDLFQRLNAGGTQANSQELRNCIMLMVNGQHYRAVKSAAEQQPFRMSSQSQKNRLNDSATWSSRSDSQCILTQAWSARREWRRWQRSLLEGIVGD